MIIEDGGTSGSVLFSSFMFCKTRNSIAEKTDRNKIIKFLFFVGYDWYVFHLSPLSITRFSSSLFLSAGFCVTDSKGKKGCPLTVRFVSTLVFCSPPFLL